MERTIILIFLCTAVEGNIGEHIFVSKMKTWLDAQTYCREHYTDLSFVSNQRDQDKLLAAAGGNEPRGWIGLYRDPDSTAWKWSGGGNITYQNWIKGQPDNYLGFENTVHIEPNGQWNDAPNMTYLNFYCIDITVVQMKRSWEVALHLCRQTHTSLTILHSENERLLAQKVIQKVNITKPVWIGLRYLVDRWLWMNGDPLVFQAWPQGGHQDHQCPIWERCGALTTEGLWESWDCQDQLNFICY